MTLTELEYVQQRMQHKWYDLVAAEQQGASIQALERLYSSYILTVEEYNRCTVEYQRTHQDQPLIVPTRRKQDATIRTGERKKKVS